MVSDISSDDEEAGQSSKTHTRTKPKYRKEWENLPEFKTWLMKDSANDCNAKCTICSKTIVAELSTIKRHGKTLKHKQLQSQISAKQKSVMNRFLQSKGMYFSK